MLRKRAIASLLLSAALLTQPAAAFSDVPEGTWYTQDVSYVEDHGLFEGVGENAFAPDETMTRAMFVTVLSRMTGAADCADCGFADVPAGSWYAKAVNWALASGIATGATDTEFQPDSPVTREQIAALILRFCDYLGYSLPQQEAPRFTDAAQVSAYAREAVARCQKAGLITGYPDGTLRPQASATRAEVSKIIAQLGTLLEEAGYSIGPASRSGDWALLLVNPWNTIPEDYTASIRLKTVENGYQVDARIYDDLVDMLSDMRAEGLHPVIHSAFRTHAYQQTLYNNQVSKYRALGYSRQEAQDLAGRWVAVPGTSEHELGLAVDISMYTSDSDEIHAWLMENSYRYGFICRYPADKTDITGIHPEPWHYRYVGRAHAQTIHASGLTLEEYLAA